MRQQITPELLDHDLGTPSEIRDSLRDLWRVNRYLGGLRSLRHALEVVLARRPLRQVTILDVGAGSGEVGGWMRTWLKMRGVTAQVWVLDRRISHLAIHPVTGGESNVIPIAADALALPFPDHGIDLVTCNLFLHHFHGEEATALLRSLYRVAGTAVIISDLERSVWPWLFIRLMPRPFVSRLSRFDGPASVRQAYRAEELRRLLADASLPPDNVWRQWPFRLGAVLWQQSRTHPAADPK